MPMLIDEIDAISRQKQRDVLYLHFESEDADDDNCGFYENHVARKKILKWFKSNGIPYWPCGLFADENSMMGYSGQIYIDVPFDLSDQAYQKVQNYLENPDGTLKLKFKGTKFCYLPFEQAMKNSHHDEPDFWSKWAESF